MTYDARTDAHRLLAMSMRVFACGSADGRFHSKGCDETTAALQRAYEAGLNARAAPSSEAPVPMPAGWNDDLPSEAPAGAVEHGRCEFYFENDAQCMQRSTGVVGRPLCDEHQRRVRSDLGLPVSPQGDGPRVPPEAARKVESAADMYKRLSWPEPSDAKKWANLDCNLRASRRVVVPPVFPRPKDGPRVADVWRGTWNDALDWHLLQPEGDGWIALAECGRRRHVFKDSDFTDGTLTFVRRGDEKPQGKS